MSPRLISNSWALTLLPWPPEGWDFRQEPLHWAIAIFKRAVEWQEARVRFVQPQPHPPPELCHLPTRTSVPFQHELPTLPPLAATVPLCL